MLNKSPDLKHTTLNEEKVFGLTRAIRHWISFLGRFPPLNNNCKLWSLCVSKMAPNEVATSLFCELSWIRVAVT
jgi:hypothetical protein